MKTSLLLNITTSILILIDLTNYLGREMTMADKLMYPLSPLEYLPKSYTLQRGVTYRSLSYLYDNDVLLYQNPFLFPYFNLW